MFPKDFEYLILLVCSIRTVMIHNLHGPKLMIIDCRSCDLPETNRPSVKDTDRFPFAGTVTDRRTQDGEMVDS